MSNTDTVIIQPSTNPFASLAARQRLKEEADAAAAEQARVQQEKERAQQREAQQAATKAAEAEHRAQVRREHLERQVLAFGKRFLRTLEEKIERWSWSSDQILEAGKYANALLMPGEKEANLDLPEVSDHEVKQEVESVFTFGLALAEAEGTSQNIMEDQYFAGQRQDWFPKLFDKKRDEARSHKERQANSATKRVFYSSSSKSMEPQG